jgi:uncharacterized protein (DUF433 family)
MVSTPPKTTSRYVSRDPEILQGEPIVTGAQAAVRDIVVLWKSGVQPEDSHKLYELITPAQVFDAISFYLDNSQEVDEWIAWYEARPHLNVSPTFKHNPLWDDVIKNIEAYRREIDAEYESQTE